MIFHRFLDTMKLSRRQFLAVSAVAGLGVIGGYLYVFSGKRRAPLIPPGDNGTVSDASKVYMVETTDRGEGTRMLLGEFGDIDFRDKSVALKANFNSADPPPASTHLDTLEELVGYLRDAGAGDVTLAERSGMGDTGAVLESMGVNDLGERLGFTVISLDDLPAEGWEKVEADWLSWKDGFYIAKVFREADRVIQTCCLKTHRYGGHFTMSLKNSVGLVAKKAPGDSHDYMQELHTSPLQRVMIGEINAFYAIDLAVMDAVEAFTTGGPDKGDLVRPGLMLASRDRVALDAVGVAILRSYGSTRDVMKGDIFELDQIRRAAEIGVGVSSAEDIELVPLNDGAVEKVEEIKGFLSG
jgi:uncharacterized protein (DUF362 family)